MSMYPLPESIRSHVKWLKGRAKFNPQLYLRKLQPWHKSDNDHSWTLDRTKFLNGFIENCQINSDTHQQYLQRWEAIVRQYSGRVISDLETAERLVVGLGAASSIETNITTHTIYGFPYIPASAIKGVCSTVCLYTVADQFGIEATPADSPEKRSSVQHLLRTIQMSDEEQRTSWMKLKESYPDLPTISDLLQNDDVQLFRRLFGATDQRGELIFFDGLPAFTRDIWEVDIMTPHFQTYYTTSSKFPGDDMDKVPIAFLTVKAETLFHFGIACQSDQDTDLIEIGSRWLRVALCELGIGAKTNRGYGRFQVTSSS